MNNLLKEYVMNIAQEEVTDEEAGDFISGLNQFIDSTYVKYDCIENGFLESKTANFDSFLDAVDFSRSIKSFSKPILGKR